MAIDQDQGLGKFYTAVVIEYFSRPLLEDEIESFASKYSDLEIPVLAPERLLNMPAGSILGKIIDDIFNDVIIFYPLFPHISLPAKAGEQIIVLFGSSSNGDRDRIGYWLTRKTSGVIAEDANYTHNDRSNYAAGVVSQTISQNIAKKFVDNGNIAISYADVVENSVSYDETFQGEIVPRYLPKSPDTSIQGSNNTLIVLGSNSSLGKTKAKESGMIDIVAGRGQSEKTKPTSVYTNTRNYDEVDKTAALNENEGDLDLINDLSRVNISIGLNVDSDFSIGVGENAGAGPAVVLKTDQIRLLARQDLKIVVGTGEDPSSIIMKSNGDIIITPSSTGVIKLGGEDASGAILASEDAVVTAGKVVAPSIVSTAGGILAAPSIPQTGVFSTKVLVKVN